MTTLIGIDTGGTFTDFVLWRDGEVRIHKVLSTPQAPEQAILQGIAELGLETRDLRIVHGSTVATNAVLEGKGVRTVYIADHGLKDVLTIGRQARPELYDLQPPPRQPPVPEELCLETGGRLAASGECIEPLTAADLQELREQIARLAPEAIAINLLFSWRDDTAERTIAAALPAELFVSRSSEVLPISGEYERGIATWLNAWVGPIVARYLDRLSAGLPQARIAVMQSSGEAVETRQTARHAVRLLLSGPAGGLAGAAFTARVDDTPPRLLSFDMGGTSTDVAVIQGEPHLTSEGRIAGYPVALPMVDMHTIGAGGGSIARADAGGLLLVGPESAGASPGPACYGRGGRQPTVTDANLVLGRLPVEEFLGGRMQLDQEAALTAMQRLGDELGMEPMATAEGILQIANEHMARALRAISVQRGLDPRDFVLTSFGGAGGLHVCALAEALEMREAMVPIHAGVLSALGMLVTPAGRTLTRASIGLLEEIGAAAIRAGLAELSAAARRELQDEGIDPAQLHDEPSLDLRYHGQSYTLNLPWTTLAGVSEAFHRKHADTYGHRMEMPIELVNLRVRVRAAARALRLPEFTARTPERAVRMVRAFGCAAPVPVQARTELAADQVITGPAIITDPVATVWLAPGWQAQVDRIGNLRLRRT